MILFLVCIRIEKNTHCRWCGFDGFAFFAKTVARSPNRGQTLELSKSNLWDWFLMGWHHNFETREHPINHCNTLHFCTLTSNILTSLTLSWWKKPFLCAFCWWRSVSVRLADSVAMRIWKVLSCGHQDSHLLPTWMYTDLPQALFVGYVGWGLPSWDTTRRRKRIPWQSRT